MPRFNSSGFSNIAGLSGFKKSSFNSISRSSSFIGLPKLFKLPGLLNESSFKRPLEPPGPPRLPNSPF